MSVCEVVVCETISPDGGVCEDCVDNTMNSGGCLECANEECDIRFMCDNCGTHSILGYMGGDSSVFLCCAECWDEVEALDPEERDYQAEQIHDLCSSCRDVKIEDLEKRIAILESQLSIAFEIMTDRQIEENKHLFQQQPNKGDSDSTDNNGDETQ